MRYANILIESYSVIISLILALYLGVHRNLLRRQKNWFLVMLISDMIMTLSDMTDWIFGGVPGTGAGIALTVGMVVYFASSGVFLASYTFYLLAYLNKPFCCVPAYISLAAGGIQILFALISPWTGFFFSITPENVYQRGSLFLLSQLTAVVVYIVQIILIVRGSKGLLHREVLFLSGYIVIPVIGEVCQVLLYDIALLNVGATVAMLLVFINVQSSQELRVRDAEAKAQAKTDFLANMSHEIRTPINAVLGMNEMILREAKEPQVLEYAGNIDNAGKKLLGIINDILDFSKMESHKLEIVPVPYKISELVYGLYTMIEERAEKKDLELIFEVNPDVPENLVGDEVRVSQIVLNLLTNAVKYTDSGYVKLVVSAKEHGDEVILRFRVKDTGLGIQQKDIGRLFDSFQRVDEEKNRSIEGTGLGLSIVNQLADLMHGQVSVQSTYGLGSEFMVTIPQKKTSDEPVGNYEGRVRLQKKESVDHKPERVAFAAPDARILAVDDNGMNLKVLQGLLRRTKVVLELAESGFEAIEKLQNNTYDLILLDHRMPKMDGVETLHKMLEDGLIKSGEPAVIALTANAFSGAREQYIEKGFQDYLSKPIAGGKLEQMLLQWLPNDKIHPADPDVEEEAPAMKKDQTADGKAEHASGENKRTDEKAGNGVMDGTRSETGNAVTEGTSDENVAEEEETLADLWQVLERDQAMEYAGEDEEMLFMNLSFFCENAETLDGKLCADYEAKDFENYSIHAHALKSNAATIGAVELSAMAKELEFAGKEKEYGKILEKHAKLIETYRSLVQYLQEHGVGQI